MAVKVYIRFTQRTIKSYMDRTRVRPVIEKKLLSICTKNK